MVDKEVLLHAENLEKHFKVSRGQRNVLEQVEGAGRFYSIFDKRIFHSICQGGHAFHAEFLDDMLSPSA